MDKCDAWLVGPESVRMLELGHPWIIADGYTRRWPTGKPGQVVALSDDEGRFIASALLDPQDRIVARVLSRRRMQLDRAWLTQRISQAIELRRVHAALGDTDAYRLVNAEGDGLPGLTVDRYGDWLLVQFTSLALAARRELLLDLLREKLQPAGI